MKNRRQNQLRSTTVGPVEFQITTLTSAANQVLSLANHDQGQGQAVRFANAYCVAEANRNRDYRRLLNHSGINFPDGTPVAWVLRLKAKSLAPGRVRGPSLFNEVIDRGRETNVRHFLLGTTDDTLQLLQSTIHKRFPGTTISGAYAPPFGPVDDQFLNRCVERISEHPTDLIWVALGSPKQDYAATKLVEKTGITALGVGAAFDFLAGTASEAPIWMQRSGLEWLFRFATEPKRLWRRYLIGNFAFILAVIHPESD